MSEIIDLPKCNSCGGKCCRLYLSVDEGGMRGHQMWFDEYCEGWVENFIESGALLRDAGGEVLVNPESGVQPLHDPLISHAGGKDGEAYREALPKFVDIDKCQFCHPLSGCMLERKFRPTTCREFMCQPGQFA